MPSDIPRQYVVRERHHRIHDPFSPAKLARLGEVLDLHPGSRVLDLGSGSGEMLCTWARDHGVTGLGVDLSSDFTAAARARAVELGVADLVHFAHANAAGFVDPTPGDVAACLGATWIGDDVLGTADLLARSLRPGGTVVVGHPFWLEVPPTDEAVRGSHATSADDFELLPDLVASFAGAGWDVVQMVLADPDDWDHYAAAQWWTTRRWLDENPDDELWAELRAELDTAPYRHVAYTRRYLGWGTFALRRR